MSSWADMTADVEAACADAFGQPVSYRVSGVADPIVITAVFDEETAIATLSDESSTGQIGMMTVSTVAPTLIVQRAILPFEPAEGHLADVSGRRYRVSDVRPDGPAAWMLILKRLRG